MKPADPDFEARTRASFARQGIMGLIGATMGRVEAGRVEIELAFRPELSQQHGFFHAGVIATIADSAGGYAGFTLFPADAGVLTVEFKVNLLAAADGERALAVGEVIRSGRTLTVCRLDAWVEKGGRRTHCATGTQTLMTLVGRAGVKD
ncbi:MAG TPA: PaaI family thioesterase [Usitatibacter sp.]|nr:PaaI family thioesterase [Usitatibacter sp.]